MCAFIYLYLFVYIKYVHLEITLICKQINPNMRRKAPKSRVIGHSGRAGGQEAASNMGTNLSRAKQFTNFIPNNVRIRNVAVYFVFLIPAKLCWDCWILCSFLNQFESGHSPMVFQSPQLVGEGGTDPAVTPVEPPEKLSNKRPLPFAIFCNWLAVHVVLG